MNDAHRENLSAMADGELAFDQVRFMLRRTGNDAELLATWSRYHLARDCLRGELAGVAGSDFANRVMAALDASDTARGSSARRWLRWSAGGAIAASVAVVALMVTRPSAPLGNEASGGAQPVVATAPSHAAAKPMQAPVVPRWLAASSASQLAQPAAASSFNGQIRGDTLLPAAYSRSMAPYMSLRSYPSRTAANAQRYGRTADGRWIIPLMPPSEAGHTGKSGRPH